ncbi:MAG: hypothetical protein ABJN22_14670 [Litorimonas sp.]
MSWPDDVWETSVNYTYLKAKEVEEDSQYFLPDRQFNNLLERAKRCNYARDQAALVELMRVHKHGECLDVLLPMLVHRRWVELANTPTDISFEYGDDCLSLTPAGEAVVEANLKDPDIKKDVYGSVSKFEEAYSYIQYIYPDAGCVRAPTTILTLEAEQLTG